MPTSDFNQKRNELIEDAFRVMGIVRAGATISAPQLDQGIKALNLILREEDAKGTGIGRNFWAFFERHLKLQANASIYGTVIDGLADDILELISADYRDASGDDIPLEILTAQGYEAIADKNAVGDPKAVYLKRDETLTNQLLYIWPTPAVLTAPSELSGSDGLNYMCVMSHTAALVNQPISGTSYRLYWDLTTTAGSLTGWVIDTAYTGGNAIRYAYKRPLYDFDNASDNPDMPQGWTRYLKFRLAYDLSWDYHLTDDTKRGLKGEYLEAFEVIFPQTKAKESSHHNKAMYF